MNEFTNLHPLVIIGVGIALGIIYFVSRGGFVTGKSDGPKGKNGGTEIVAISADTGALNRATTAVEAHTMTLIEFNRIHEKSSDKMIEAVEDVRRELQSLNQNIRETNLIRVSHKN